MAEFWRYIENENTAKWAGTVIYIVGKVGYSRHFFPFSTTATLFQVQTSSKFVP